MKSYKLSFGEIIILKDNLAEVIVNEGEILDLPKIVEYHDFLHANLKATFCLLINKKNAYSYTFKAQRVINDFSGIDKIAVLVNDAGGLMSTETLMSLNNNDQLNLKTFRVLENALSWLTVSKKEVS